MSYYYSYDEFKNDIALLRDRVKEFNPDTILSIARGGMIPGLFLAQAIDCRRLFTINTILYEGNQKLEKIEILNIPDLEGSKRVLVVDDIIDSGETAKAVLELLKSRYPSVKFALTSIFYKTSASISPDFAIKEAKDWIDFFWEVDIKGEL